MKRGFLILVLFFIFGLVGCGKENQISKYDEETISEINEFYISMTKLKTEVATCKSFSEMRILLENKKELFDNFSVIEIKKDSYAGQCVKAVTDSYEYKLFRSDYVTTKVLGDTDGDLMNQELLLQGYADFINVVIDKILMLIPSDFISELETADTTKTKKDEIETTKEESALIETEKNDNAQNLVDDIFKDVSVKILDKINYESDFDAGIFSQFIEMPYSITNNTNKEIKGIQGILHVQDMFGEKIIDIQYDLTSETVSIGHSVQVYGYGMEINEFMDDHMKLYDTNYENLEFVYEFSKIVFTDGTSIQ